jgi:hypothetical protein
MDKKKVIGIVLCIVVIGLIGVALFSSWWMYKEERGTGTISSRTMDFKLQEKTTVTEEVTGTNTKTVGYTGEMKDVYDTAYYMVISALATAIISLVCLCVTGMGKIRPETCVIFLTITLILTAIAPVYFATALPNALEASRNTSGLLWTRGFKGISEHGSVSWGPGVGWYLSIIAFVFVVVIVFIQILPILGNKKSEK